MDRFEGYVYILLVWYSKLYGVERMNEDYLILVL